LNVGEREMDADEIGGNVLAKEHVIPLWGKNRSIGRNVRSIRCLTVFLIFGFAVFSYGGKSAHAQAKKEQAPSFTLKLLNGGELNSSDLKGKVTVLKFVASY
jgi:hypothetical protein